MGSNRRIAPSVQVCAPIAFIRAASNLPTAPSFFSANFHSPIPAIPNTPGSRSFPAPVTKRSPDADPQIKNSHFRLEFITLGDELWTGSSSRRGPRSVSRSELLPCAALIPVSCPSRARADKLQITSVRQGGNVLAIGNPGVTPCSSVSRKES
jgi:hypothetical protein